MHDLKCVKIANQLVSTQGKIHEYLYEMRSFSALLNQSNCHFRFSFYLLGCQWGLLISEYGPNFFKISKGIDLLRRVISLKVICEKKQTFFLTKSFTKITFDNEWAYI